MKESSKKILFGILNWGLGHATRSIPIIEMLQQRGHQISVASDGEALDLLKKSLQNVEFVVLHPFEIRYSVKRRDFRMKIISQLKQLQQKAIEDNRIVKKVTGEEHFDLIISDNAFGVYSKKIKSIYITHQLNVLSGWTTFFTRWLHQQSMKRFNEIWIPDFEDEPNLSGKIGHFTQRSKLPIKYIGPLSRLEKEELPKKFEYAFILSGPEPQRSILEDKILNLPASILQNSILVRGNLHGITINSKKEKLLLEVKSYATSKELQDIINSSHIVVCRSGYTSLMDLLKMKVYAIYIPTPGQFEQEYLGEHIKKMKWGKVISQSNFNEEYLNFNVELVKDFPNFTNKWLKQELVKYKL